VPDEEDDKNASRKLQDQTATFFQYRLILKRKSLPCNIFTDFSFSAKKLREDSEMADTSGQRYGTVTADDIQNHIEKMRLLQEALSSQAQRMTESHVVSVRIDGATKFSRGVQEVQDFVINLNRAVGDAALKADLGFQGGDDE